MPGGTSDSYRYRFGNTIDVASGLHNGSFLMDFAYDMPVHQKGKSRVESGGMINNALRRCVSRIGSFIQRSSTPRCPKVQCSRHEQVFTVE